MIRLDPAAAAHHRGPTHLPARRVTQQHPHPLTTNCQPKATHNIKPWLPPKQPFAKKYAILHPHLTNSIPNTHPQRLKSALWYTIGQYIDEECLTSDINATPQFIGALTELVYTQIGLSTYNYPPLRPHTSPPILPSHPTRTPSPLRPQIANTSHDLETFSAHAGRKVITTDDVMLLTRRNDALESMLKQELDALRAAEGRGEGAAGAGAQGKKRRPAGKGKGKA